MLPCLPHPVKFEIFEIRREKFASRGELSYFYFMRFINDSFCQLWAVIGRWLCLQLLAIIFLSLSLYEISFGQDKKVPLQQLQLCWQFGSTEQTAVKPAVAAGKLLLPLAGGNLLALNSETGENLWRTELGGEIVGQIIAGENNIFVPTQISGEKQNSIVIRALSAATGVTAWQGELPQTSEVWLALRENILLATTISQEKSESKLVALSAGNGELVWTQNISAKVTTLPVIIGNNVYVALDDKTIRIHSIVNGTEQRRIDLRQEASGNLTIADNISIISDRAGNVAALRLSDGETLWRLRVGAAVQQSLITPSGVLLSSLDDFIYLHDLKTGKRRWRRRLAGRPLGAAATPIDNSVLLTVTGETGGTIVNLKKGKILNQISFGANNTVLFAPLRVKENIVVITASGASAYSPSCRIK